MKQRRVAQESQNVTTTKYDDDANRFNKDGDRDEESDEYDADSKETRLTLMEEVLLLGLKDREVCENFVFFVLILISVYTASHRATRHSGMIAFQVGSEGAF